MGGGAYTWNCNPAWNLWIAGSFLGPHDSVTLKCVQIVITEGDGHLHRNTPAVRGVQSAWVNAVQSSCLVACHLAKIHEGQVLIKSSHVGTSPGWHIKAVKVTRCSVAMDGENTWTERCMETMSHVHGEVVADKGKYYSSVGWQTECQQGFPVFAWKFNLVKYRTVTVLWVYVERYIPKTINKWKKSNTCTHMRTHTHNRPC